MAKKVSTIVSVATVALCIIASIELGAVVVMRKAADIYHVGQSFPIPSGYQLDGRYLSGTPAACFVVRVTADECPYCKQDLAHYSTLTERATAHGCRIVELSPRVGQMAPRAGTPAIQLQYVDMALGRTLNPYATPQTILLNRDGRMAWQRQGAMDDEDLGAALDSLRGLR